MGVRVDLLGPPVVRVDEERHALSYDRMAALLCYLAYRNDWARRDEFIALLWPEVQESRARHRFRQLLFETRNKYPFADIESRSDRIRWSVSTDVASMHEAPNDAARVDANRGWFLEGFHIDDAPDFESWVASERAAIHSRWRGAAVRLIEDLLRDHRSDDALEILERLERRDPLDEALAQRHIALLRELHPERAARRYQALVDVMDRELGASPSERTTAIAKGGAALDTGPATSSDQGRRGAVPVGATEFVGREDEIAEAAALLDRAEVRLLTIFAPGGMGKTRLALELARRHSADPPNDTTFVSLVHAHTVEAALASIAEALDVTIYGPRPAHIQIAEAIGEATTLLILDNLEQLDLAAELTDLLEHAPGLTILATSRRRLGVQAEWSFSLGGMAFPSDALGHDAPPFDPDAWDATRLFLGRARQRRRDLELDDAEIRAIGRIAARLGGMPLALELAARWADVLRPTDIEDELAVRPEPSVTDALETNSADAADDRQRSVHFVLEQSWRRLGERQQTALRRLSVPHGFTLRAARVVGGADPATVRELVDHAFVGSSASEGRSRRFDMHPLVRSFCAARANEHPDELASTRDAHAHHYLGWAADLNQRLLSAEAPAGLMRLYEETDNLRAAWLTAVERDFVDLIGAALKPLEFTFRSRTWYGAWGELLRHAHDRVDPETLTHARLVMSISANRLDVLDTESAQRMGEEVLPRIDAFAAEGHAPINPHPPAEVRRILGHIALADGRADDAVTRFEEALEILERDESNPHFAGRVKDYIGTAYAVAGQLTEGRTWLERAVRELRALKEPGSLAVAASNLARLELIVGSVGQARMLSSEALRLERELARRPRFLVELLRTASDVSRASEEYEEAIALLHEELRELERTALPTGPRRTVEAHDRLGQIAYLQGDMETARSWLHGALTPRACRLALLEGEPRRAAWLCTKWLELPSPHGYLTLDLDRLTDRAFVLNCAAEAALASQEDPSSVRALLLRALGYATERSLRPEVLRGAALVAWFHAEHGESSIARRLLARVASHPATDPEASALVRGLQERFDLAPGPDRNELSTEPFEDLLESALAAAGIGLSEAFLA